MHKANFTTTMLEGSNLYPLSTQTLNFIQEQIEQLQSIVYMGGLSRFILKMADKTTKGALVLNGELIEMSPGNWKQANSVRIVTENEDITADGATYKEARTRVYALPSAVAINLDVPPLYRLDSFQTLSTNAALAEKLATVISASSEIKRRLLVETVSGLTSTALDKQKDNIRIHARESFKLNGVKNYTINVYKDADDIITQEQILPNMTRYKREWKSASDKWGSWQLCTENYHLEIKIVGGNTVWVRHGVLPEGSKLVLLRKKKRSSSRRSGGDATINPEYKGKRERRQAKHQFVHFKGITLSTGVPGKWYVPKCIGAEGEDNQTLIGKELGALCRSLIYSAAEGKALRIQGVRKNVVSPATSGSVALSGTTTTSGYARVALQIAESGQGYKSAGCEMVELKYRVWFNKVSKGKYRERRGFSMK
jgi:hypothetical protein